MARTKQKKPIVFSFLDSKLSLENETNSEPKDHKNSISSIEDIEDMDLSKTIVKTSEIVSNQTNGFNGINNEMESTLKEMSNKTTIVYFIESAIDSTFMRNAFQSIQTNEWMTKTWIHFNHLNELQTIDVNNDVNNDLFVINSFDGKTYEDLIGRKARIISPLTILYWHSNHSNHSNDSKKWQSFCDFYLSIAIKSYPIFSQCMRKLIISITGFEGQQKLDLINKMQRMCGIFSKDLTTSVTHLVSDSVTSKKYKVASVLGLIVITSEWVDYCWHTFQYELCHAKQITHRFVTPIFKNLIICVSQIDSEERNHIMRIVETNGGFYRRDLQRDQNVRLLLKEANGEKFSYAQMKGIPCLDVKWIYDSLNKGYALPEEQYVID